MKEILKYKYIKYKDIKSELLTTKNECVEISDAFVENGIVYIRGVVKQGYYGNKNFNFVDSTYSPRCEAFGYASLVSSGQDANKINTISITKDGKMYLWVSAELKYYVPFTIQYPLRTS